MVQLGLYAYFKHQLLQRDGSAIQMKETSSLLGNNINKFQK